MKVSKSFGQTVAAAAFLFGTVAGGAAQVSKDAPVPPTRRSDPVPVDADARVPIENSDRELMQTMARQGLAEVEIGRIAETNAESPEVKQFARQMIEDHGKANRELQVIAARKGITLPTEPDAAHEQELAVAKKTRGAEFDKLYANEAALEDHAAAKQVFQDAAKNAEDPELRSFAQKTLPVIEQHFQMAQQLHRSINGGAPTDAHDHEPQALRETDPDA